MATNKLPNGVWLRVVAFIFSAYTVFCASATVTTAAETEQLIGLSLEELLQVTVTTVSRRPQTLSSSPAAIFVVSQTDIQRSGARTLPDILRMVPGIQVAQVDSSTWAVTARGPNGIFANKLLVLMDGRTLYSPMFSGVRWDVQDTDLSSIERIEVIRGPGAVMWGSNAVNGVINIITKDASETPGLRADVAVGSLTRAEATVRWGGSAGSAVDYRVYAKYFDRNGDAPKINGSSYDDWDMGRVGTRIDWEPGENDSFTITAEHYDGSVGENFTANSVTPPYTVNTDVTVKPTGSFLTMNWNRTLSETSDLHLQVYYDHSERGGVAPAEDRDTYDLDFQHHFKLGSRNDIVWGFGIRLSEDRTIGSETFALYPADRTQRLYSGFVQDEIRLHADDLFLTLGTKVEKNSFSQSNAEWSPNVRLSWLMSETSTLWGSVAKAIRTPNRIEQNARILGDVVPPFTGTNTFPVPFAVTVNGDPEFDSEEVMAYELGYRAQPFEDMTIDITVFLNDYKDLRVIQAGDIVCQPAGLSISNPACFASIAYAELPLSFINQAKQDTKGFELALSFVAQDWWRMYAAYTFLKMGGDTDSTEPNSAGEDSPENQLSLRSNMSLGTSSMLDLWLRYVGELEKQQVDAYVALDARLAWQATDSIRLSLIGRNLLDSSHLEFHEEFGSNQAIEIKREALAELVWQF